jgi:hypothetical protein
MSIRGSHVLAALAAVALTTVAACGSPASSKTGTGAKVATLSSPTAASPSAAGPQPPRMRIDMTAAEEAAMRAPYEKCLKARGLTVVDAKKASDVVTKGGKPNEAAQYCESHYLPLPPWEQDPANPEAKDFEHDVDTCFKAKGGKVDADGVSYESKSLTLQEGMAAYADCEQEVYAKRK